MRKTILTFLLFEVVMFVITGCGNNKKLANKAVSYLEKNDYNCNNATKYDGFKAYEGQKYEGNLYICSKTNGVTENTFVIKYDEEFKVYYIFEEKYSDETINYILSPITFEEEYISRIWLYKNNEQFAIFEHNKYTDDEKEYVSIQDKCLANWSLDEWKNTDDCKYSKAYKNKVNESIKEYKNLYKELELELPIK